MLMETLTETETDRERETERKIEIEIAFRSHCRLASHSFPFFCFFEFALIIVMSAQFVQIYNGSACFVMFTLRNKFMYLFLFLFFFFFLFLLFLFFN